MGKLHLDRGQLDHLVRMVRGRFEKFPLSTETGIGLDLDDLGGRQQHPAMPWVTGLGARSALRASVCWPLLIQKLDGKQEALLIALACGTPPEERPCWTMPWLADRLVALQVVDTISDETVRRTLKKTRSSPG